MGTIMVACAAGVAALVAVSVTKNRTRAATQQPQGFIMSGKQWQLPPPGSAAAEQLLASPHTPGKQVQ
jgi:hypothetical protein